MSAPSVEQALRLAQGGRAAEAETMLTAAGERGDAAAWMQLAVWRLIGEPLPRDVPLARKLLRKAVGIGHVDAALMEIALTANGSGAKPDWSRALALLRTAARADPVAAQQLGLVSAMTLDARGDPVRLPPATSLAERPAVTLVRGFLSQRECEHIAGAGNAVLQPASVVDPATGRQIAHPIRTSYEGQIGPAREDLVIQAINRRIAALSGTNVAQGEPLTVLRYTAGQEYRLHNDAIPGEPNQRLRTVLLYLNQGYRGGETEFPDLNLRIRGEPGDALMFDNLDTDGRPLPQARHAGRPIVDGVKWLATRWIRARPLDLWALR